MINVKTDLIRELQDLSDIQKHIAFWEKSEGRLKNYHALTKRASLVRDAVALLEEANGVEITEVEGRNTDGL